MPLSDAMQQELDRRLQVAERERADDPAFIDLPRTDRLWLWGLLVASLIGVAIQQAL
jgi:hypothetical protein